MNARGLLLVAFIGAAALLQADESKRLTPLQQAQARVLLLEQENEQLRRSVLSLQVQLESLRGPQEAEAREHAWHALEQELGCALDRQTLVCKAEAPAK